MNLNNNSKLKLFYFTLQGKALYIVYKVVGRSI